MSINSKTKVVNFVSNIRVDSSYVKSYINQISSLTQKNYEIGKIILICDDLSRPSEVLEWGICDKRVALYQEKKNDYTLDSIEDKTLQWADLCNQGVESSLSFKSDYTLFIEPDLCFPLDLVDQLVFANLDITAPIVFLGAGFYDSWGFRTLDGEKIGGVDGINVHAPLVELSSVGSCVLFKTEIFSRGVRFRGPYETGLLVGVCNDARKLGYKVWALPWLSIVHPTSIWMDQMWRVIKFSINLEDEPLTINVNQLIPGAYSEFIAEVLHTTLKGLIDPPIERGEYGFKFVKNKNDRTIEVNVFNFIDSKSHFKFNI